MVGVVAAGAAVLVLFAILAWRRPKLPDVLIEETPAPVPALPGELGPDWELLAYAAAPRPVDELVPPSWWEKERIDRALSRLPVLDALEARVEAHRLHPSIKPQLTVMDGSDDGALSRNETRAHSRFVPVAVTQPALDPPSFWFIRDEHLDVPEDERPWLAAQIPLGLHWVGDVMMPVSATLIVTEEGSIRSISVQPQKDPEIPGLELREAPLDPVQRERAEAVTIRMREAIAERFDVEILRAMPLLKDYEEVADRWVQDVNPRQRQVDGSSAVPYVAEPLRPVIMPDVELTGVVVSDRREPGRERRRLNRGLQHPPTLGF